MSVKELQENTFNCLADFRRKTCHWQSSWQCKNVNTCNNISLTVLMS